MTPPAAVGFANGAAQSIVSLARFLGPILGGYVSLPFSFSLFSDVDMACTCWQLWSASTQNDPSGYPLGFLACGAVCAFAVAHSFLIR